MVCVEEKLKEGSAHNLLQGIKLLQEMQDHSAVGKQINPELWHACAGPLVSLPHVGGLVFYFPQGHSEQVAVSTNRMATAQIPSYPNLPSQLLCQVHNVTLHADKEADEIYAQMSLQPVNNEKDVIPMPDFGLKPSKHPTEFFCKTLTSSDTSTHGGFSVPRRAAEKLFPQLDYSMQPPTQELIVLDLHNNTWTFPHIYRGQPKRHLLTTGWSMFVGAKRLRAGDAILFIRDEKSQLLLGVRRANRQQTVLPSSVLSTDSMHIGILAAAAHAAVSRSPFTIFYNPRACPSEFVIPFAKYRKAIHGTQLSISMRFGMMFETEESSKSRYMGTITGISDLDPLRWPNSKWRSLQVEWDEPRCGDKQNRVSPWEIETPESLFIFPSLMANLKRPFHSAFLGTQPEWETPMNRSLSCSILNNSQVNLQNPPLSSLWSDQLTKMLIKPHGMISQRSPAPTLQDGKNSALREGKSMMQPAVKQKPDSGSRPMIPQEESHCVMNSDELLPPKPATLPLGKGTDSTKVEPGVVQEQSSQLEQEKLSGKPMNSQNPVNNVVVGDQNTVSESHIVQTQQIINLSEVESTEGNALVHFPAQAKHTHPEMSQDTVYVGALSVNQELWNDPHFNSAKLSSQPTLLSHQDMPSFHYSACGLKDLLSHESHTQTDIYACFNLDISNSGSAVVDPSLPNIVLDDFCALKNADFHSPSDYLVSNFCSNQDVQSQITSASLADSQNFSIHEYADNSGGTSSSNVDFDDNNLLQHSSWQQVTPRFRTYTKIQKAGSVGRSIDVSSFKNYDELRLEIERMFGLEGLLNDLTSGWKLVYIDFESDVLLVGDDPWQEFVGCVRCIRILSPSEVEQISKEGMQLLNSGGLQTVNGST